MSFHRWLLAQQDLDHPIGDLARDVAQDTCMPTSVREMRAHLVRHGAWDRVVQVFDEAVAYWRAGKV